MMRIVKYIAVGCIGFVIFLFFTFPYDQLRLWMMTQADDALGAPWSVHIDDVSPHWLSVGAEMSGVEIRRAEKIGARPKPVLNFHSIDLDVALISSLLGAPEAELAVEIGDGELLARVMQSAEAASVDLSMSTLDLRELGVIRELTGIKLAGELRGDANLSFEPGQIKSTQGEARIIFDDWQIEKGSTIKMGSMGELSIADLGVKSLVLSKDKDSGITLDIENGTVNIAQCSLAGGDVQISLLGKVYLAKRLSNSRVNLKGKLILSDALKQKIPVALFGPANADDGSYPLLLTGRFSKLKKRIGTFNF